MRQHLDPLHVRRERGIETERTVLNMRRNCDGLRHGNLRPDPTTTIPAMPSPTRGLYEELITEALEADLLQVGETLRHRRRSLPQAEAADRISLHLARVVKKAIECLKDKERVTEGIRLARRILRLIDKALPEAAGHAHALQQRPTRKGDLLEAIEALRPDGKPETIPSPLTPLLDTTLLTNAPHEPRVGHQILTEIHSADRIDIVMAFIRRSGIRPMLPALQRHRENGRPLRVLTTTYTGSTEERALDELQKIGAEVFVSYDLTTTRLHAKAWLFHRDSGFSTAYIGSSNLTHSAQITGLEWNVRVSGARNPDVIRQVAAMFEAYRNSGDFLPYNREEFRNYTEAAKSGPTVMLSPLHIRLEPFQERLLELIALSRQKGHHRNLLVSATGTGKTVMAAVDYGRLRTTLQREAPSLRGATPFVVRRSNPLPPLPSPRGAPIASTTCSPRSRASTPAASRLSTPPTSTWSSSTSSTTSLRSEGL